MSTNLDLAAKAGLRAGALCLFIGLAQPVAAHELVPCGSEFQVNTYTASNQTRPFGAGMES